MGGGGGAALTGVAIVFVRLFFSKTELIILDAKNKSIFESLVRNVK